MIVIVRDIPGLFIGRFPQIVETSQKMFQKILEHLFCLFARNTNLYNLMYNEILGMKKALRNQGLSSYSGGDGGIRTLDSGFARMLP